MDQLEKVYDIIDKSGIKVFNYKIPGSKGATIEYDGQYGIFLDYSQIEDSHEEFMVLSHEYGHCKSGSTHGVETPINIIKKHEYIANKAAIFEFLPIKSLRLAISNGCKNIYEISEFLNLPPKFVKQALDIYTAKEMI